MYCFEVNSLNLVKTNIVKDKIAHSTGGIALDSEIKKIFKISNRTFIATSSKIFSLDGQF